MIVTAPDETAKSEFENDATPLELAVASVPAILTSSSDTVVATPFAPDSVSAVSYTHLRAHET